MGSEDGWGFADMYDMEGDSPEKQVQLDDVKSDDYRNILVLGRAAGRSVYAETKSLIGHARYLADQLGCRVEVLLIGSKLDAAVEDVKKYAVDNVYTVDAPDYAPIQHTATILSEVVKKRRPELVLVFQSRSGDAITAYAAAQLGAGFALGATKVDIDTNDRIAQVTHQGKNPKFQVVTSVRQRPAFISVQRGTFRAPMEDPYSTTNHHALEIDVGRQPKVVVEGQRDPPEPTIESAERVVIAGTRIHSKDDLEAARKLAEHLDAAFGVTQSVSDRGLDTADDPIVGVRHQRLAAKLAVTVGCTGGLNLLESLAEVGTIVAIGSGDSDPINTRCAYRVAGSVSEAVHAVLEGL